MPEVEFQYTWEYRGDWFRMTVFKNGWVVFDDVHESHWMSDEEAAALGDALYNTVGPGKEGRK